MDRGNNSRAPETALDPDSAKRTRYGTPPDDPKYDLMKSQMNRTISNYQKAYRKKVEGLKVELGAVRSDNARLKSEVRKLRRQRRVHLPSLGLGLLAGWLTKRFVVQLLEALRAPAQPQPQHQQAQAQQQEAQQAAAAPVVAPPPADPAPVPAASMEQAAAAQAEAMAEAQ